MFTLPNSVRVYVALGPCDMRRQSNGLAAMVRQFHRDPRSGDLYIFRNRRCDIIRILFHDKQGFCVFTKRLDSRRFRWIVHRCAEEGEVEITASALAELMRTVTERKMNKSRKR